jgi:3-oxoacyl-[acyl-carrier protein] reductase
MANTNPSRLVGRRALVTGASRGIGAAIVRCLAADGAAVAFTYNLSVAEAEKLVAEVAGTGATVTAIRADSTDPAAIDAAVQQAAGFLGGLDVLVNNAGVGYMTPLGSPTTDEFDRMVAINIVGTYMFARSAITHLGPGSRIINIGSINAERVQAPGLAAYAMTKGAVASLTKGLARELGPRGITVNNVQPGPVETDANPAEGAHADVSRAIMAIGRYGRVEEVAAVVSFLAGDDTDYITGANWNVDGGFTV